jgi:hypothetical protein
MAKTALQTIEERTIVGSTVYAYVRNCGDAFGSTGVRDVCPFLSAPETLPRCCNYDGTVIDDVNTMPDGCHLRRHSFHVLWEHHPRARGF